MCNKEKEIKTPKRIISEISTQLMLLVVTETKVEHI